MPAKKEDSSVPQKVNPPYIVFSLSGGEAVRHHGGDTGVVEAIVNMEFVEQTHLDAETLYDTVRQNIDSSGATTWGSVQVQRAFLDEPIDSTSTTGTGAAYDFPTYTAQLSVVYERTAASP